MLISKDWAPNAPAQRSRPATFVESAGEASPVVTEGTAAHGLHIQAMYSSTSNTQSSSRLGHWSLGVSGGRGAEVRTGGGEPFPFESAFVARDGLRHNTVKLAGLVW